MAKGLFCSTLNNLSLQRYLLTGATTVDQCSLSWHRVSPGRTWRAQSTAAWFVDEEQVERTAVVQYQTRSQLVLLVQQLTKQARNYRKKKTGLERPQRRNSSNAGGVEARDKPTRTAKATEPGKRQRPATAMPNTSCTKAPNRSNPRKRCSDLLVGDILPGGPPAQKSPVSNEETPRRSASTRQDGGIRAFGRSFPELL